jgi:hypothetical protein
VCLWCARRRRRTCNKNWSCRSELHAAPLTHSPPLGRPASVIYIFAPGPARYLISAEALIGHADNCISAPRACANLHVPTRERETNAQLSLWSRERGDAAHNYWMYISKMHLPEVQEEIASSAHAGHVFNAQFARSTPARYHFLLCQMQQQTPPLIWRKQIEFYLNVLETKTVCA